MSEMQPCPECEGTGQGFMAGDPDYRWYWCPTCWGTGVLVEDAA